MTLQQSVTQGPFRASDSRAAASIQSGPHSSATNFDIPPAPLAATLTEARRRLRAERMLVESEEEWRRLQHPAGMTGSTQRVAASRWYALEDKAREASAQTASDIHIVKIILRPMNLRLSIDGK